jgi:pyridoxal phosphate enzyme (YggS family)
VGDLVNEKVVAQRLAEVRQRVAGAGGSPDLVTVVAVTKGFGPDAVRAAAAAGIEDIGENYAQEMLAKLAGAPSGLRWHFLGQLQRNKLARLAPHVHLWHGVDGEAEALALARRRPGAAVLVEVRSVGPSKRPGVRSDEVAALALAARAAGLEVRGLMTVAPRDAPDEEVMAHFGAVAALARELGLPELSMGMSADFELAVAAGATILRLGRALFGERPARRR